MRKQLEKHGEIRKDLEELQRNVPPSAHVRTGGLHFLIKDGTSNLEDYP